VRFHSCIDRPAAPGPLTPRGAFSLVEVLVALMVVCVGLLGVAGVSATALRTAGAAVRERAAVTRARTRLALLQASGCAGAADGEVRVRGRLTERWSAGASVNGVRLLEARAEWDDVGQRRTVLIPGALLC
jgi:prepilin-type N-terminal cleavage/methylation domain-containing protein